MNKVNSKVCPPAGYIHNCAQEPWICSLLNCNDPQQYAPLIHRLTNQSNVECRCCPTTQCRNEPYDPCPRRRDPIHSIPMRECLDPSPIKQLEYIKKLKRDVLNYCHENTERIYSDLLDNKAFVEKGEGEDKRVKTVGLGTLGTLGHQKSVTMISPPHQEVQRDERDIGTMRPSALRKDGDSDHGIESMDSIQSKIDMLKEEIRKYKEDTNETMRNMVRDVQMSVKKKMKEKTRGESVVQKMSPIQRVIPQIESVTGKIDPRQSVTLRARNVLSKIRPDPNSLPILENAMKDAKNVLRKAKALQKMMKKTEHVLQKKKKGQESSNKKTSHSTDKRTEQPHLAKARNLSQPQTAGQERQEPQPTAPPHTHLNVKQWQPAQPKTPTQQLDEEQNWHFNEQQKAHAKSRSSRGITPADAASPEHANRPEAYAMQPQGASQQQTNKQQKAYHRSRSSRGITPDDASSREHANRQDA